MKVVIVDDHPLVRKGLIAVLANEEEIEVVGVSEGVEDAMETIERTEPDLAIVDIRLGEQSGFELVENLRHLPCRFIMLTSSAAEFDVRRAEESGADGYVLKNSMPEELLLAIKMVEKGTKILRSRSNGSVDPEGSGRSAREADAEGERSVDRSWRRIV